MRTLKITGLGGSLRDGSTSLSALQVALEGARKAGAAIELLDLKRLDLPLYGSTDSTPPDAVRLADAIHDADGLVWASPMYHGTISGAFKNALDWLQLLGDREPAYLTNKPVGLLATAGGTQGLQAINTMEFVVRALRGYAVPLVVPVSEAWKVFDREGRLTDAKVRQQLETLGREVVDVAWKLAAPQPVLAPELLAAVS